MSAPHSQGEAYLAREQAFGMPFNKIYGPAYPGGVTLPREMTMTDSLTMQGLTDPRKKPRSNKVVHLVEGLLSQLNLPIALHCK